MPIQNKILKKYYGFDSFRKDQQIIVDKVMKGEDVLAILPTGGGKSICYQVPALSKKGTCIVISPIISLMYDQVQSLKSKNIEAEFINSSLSKEKQNDILEKLYLGKLKFLYIAPERFKKNDFLTILKNINISFVAIDEAHCISQWGHDFRPEYSNIKYYLKDIETNNSSIKSLQIICLTATATQETKKDIIETSGLKNPSVVIGDFSRKNLSFSMHHPSSKKDMIINIVNKMKGKPTIIYCSSREKVDNCYSLFSNFKNINVAKYHAGISQNERQLYQDGFIQNKYNLLIATNAFGMGVDKPDVRCVIHYDMPSSMEAYYQEAGRAGRDGKEAECHLMYSPYDRRLHETLLNTSTPHPSIVKQMKDIIDYWPLDYFDPKVENLQISIPPLKLSMLDSIYSIFEKENIINIEYINDNNIIKISEIINRNKNIDHVYENLKNRRISKARSLEVMERYCNGNICLVNYMLNYFDQDNKEPCNKCSNCIKHNEEIKGKEDYSDIAKKIISVIKNNKNLKIKKELLYKICYGVVDVSTIITKSIELSQFGILSYLGEKKAKELIDKLIDDQYITYNGDIDEYLYMSKKGDKLISNKIIFLIEKNELKIENKENNKALITKKIELIKKEIANEEFIPPFMMWTSKTTKELVDNMPKSLNDLKKINGLNEYKIEKYGNKILNIINGEHYE